MTNPKPQAGSQEDSVSTREFPRIELRPLSVGNAAQSNGDGASVPRKFGRYQIQSLLGKGGFGAVYRAWDEQLQRNVAVKVTFGRTADEAAHGLFLREARNVAGLDHPNIVPIYDVGTADEGGCFIVSKLIEGSDLARRLSATPLLSQSESVSIVAKMADALQHAHCQGLIHRDVKPANILLDSRGNPYLGDFGIAIREEDFGHRNDISGTPVYMSPEQARGEGHLIDHRSDIYSLGVVLYELLTGRRPFRADNTSEMLRLIANTDVRTPRLFCDTISVGLERVVMKALARRASDRYQLARDFAEELRQCLQGQTTNESPPSNPGRLHDMYPADRYNPNMATPSNQQPASESAHQLSPLTPVAPTAVTTQPDIIKVVPKGLRSYDLEDAEFFLQLLPGPTDRTGLPESIRFWKQFIESHNEKAHRIGLICGPSGCGKSSFVKAGLLPRLSSKVVTVYVDANSDDTELAIVRKIKAIIPDAEGSSLREVLANIRRRKLLPSDGKLLLVVDQFEQWLNLQSDYRGTGLSDGLRQCDSAQIQAILMVRDDFWLPVSRFLRELEVALRDGENSWMVDLFDQEHATNVLAMFGIAYGKLSPNPSQWTTDQDKFLKSSIEGLAENRKVTPVRIAIFADLMKGRVWVPKSLQDVGGIAGVGITFLDESFLSRTAPPDQRHHCEAAKGLLQALLPPIETEIKGHVRPTAALQRAAGYENKPEAFKELLQILDRKLRLISAVVQDHEISRSSSDRSRQEASHSSDLDSNAGLEPSYQLTHDYLVPAVRTWLSRQQLETRRGRAMLRLQQRAEAWAIKQEKQQLPSMGEWLSITLLTRVRYWSPKQRSMMRIANRRYIASIVITLFAIAILVSGLQYWAQWKHSELIAQQVVGAVEIAASNVGDGSPFAIRDIKRLPKELTLGLLKQRFDSEENVRRKLGLAMALAELGDVKVDFLADCVDHIENESKPHLIKALSNDAARTIETLSNRAAKAVDSSNLQLRAKLASISVYLGDHRLVEWYQTPTVNEAPDPRTIFIDEFCRWRGPKDVLIRSLEELSESPLRYTLALAVGRIPLDEFSVADRERIAELFYRWYSTSPDPSIHSAVKWAMYKWGLSLEFKSEPPKAPSPNSNWFVNSLGQTMLKLPKGVLRQEAESAPDGERRNVQMDSEYWLSDCEVTVKQFQQFVAASNKQPGEELLNWPGYDGKISPTPNHPVQQVNWSDAVAFCNWLSRREGLSPCYERAESTESGAGWLVFQERNGYRLPSELEWEYGCRAESSTDFSTGNELFYLGEYCEFYPSVRTVDVGSKLPNAFGFFGMHGNVWEWCEDTWNHDPNGGKKVNRGGGWDISAKYCRSLVRGNFDENGRPNSLGFRVALGSRK